MEREFKVKRLLIILAVVAGIGAFVFVPYGLSFIYLPSHNLDYTPRIINYTWGNVTYAAPRSDYVPIPVQRWGQGFADLIFVLLYGSILFVIGYIIYSLYNWVFPRTYRDMK